VDTEPHERERMKQSARPGEEQTVKVVENDAGGRPRGWKPATRNHRAHGVGSPVVPSGTGDDRASRQVYTCFVMVIRIRIVPADQPAPSSDGAARTTERQALGQPAEHRTHGAAERSGHGSSRSRR
jgi:hypothetical protein